MEYIKAVLFGIILCGDAFVASISEGLAIRKLQGKKLFGISVLFFYTQGGCALLAYTMPEKLGNVFRWLDHWLAFGILAIIGTVMLIRSYHNEETDQKESNIRYITILLIGIAVSFDTLTIATTKTFTEIHSWIGVSILTVEIFAITMLGLFLGHKLGAKYRYKSELSGGILLVVLAIKILLVGIVRK